MQRAEFIFTIGSLVVGLYDKITLIVQQIQRALNISHICSVLTETLSSILHFEKK